jgi:hypothetical protein
VSAPALATLDPTPGRRPPGQQRTFGTTLDLRWELYRVEHERSTSLWKIALDRQGRFWGMKANVIPPPPPRPESTR